MYNFIDVLMKNYNNNNLIFLLNVLYYNNITLVWHTLYAQII